MNFDLVFDNSGDSIPFTVVENHELFEFFVNKINADLKNSFSNNQVLGREIDKKINDLNWSIFKTNEVLRDLISDVFEHKDNLTDYLDQDFLNKTHADWVFSQKNTVNIDEMRHSSNNNTAKIGSMLHEMYPDEIRTVKLAEAMAKIGYIFPYEEVNMSVHRLEHSFKNSELMIFDSASKWQVFDNPFCDTVVSNNNIVNFSFGYTYVGRQLYNKYDFFDDELKYQDHYNYETLETSFNLNLSKPQTIAFSPEFLSWCQRHGRRPMTTQIPIANIIDLTENLFDYRKILYNNSRDNNPASIIIK